MGKEKKPKNQSGIRELIYYTNPAHLSQEVAGLGYTLSAKKTILSYLAYFAASVLMGWLFQLNVFFIIILAMTGFLFVPIIIRNGYRNMFEQQRFSEVSEYMEHILYSFRSNRKILQSLNEVELSFREGPMFNAIQDAKKEIRNGNGKGGVERNGLKVIEDRYPCERLRAIHKFMVEVEYLGGNFDESIDLLLEDRMAWVDRTTSFQKDKKHQIINVLLSIGITILICLMIQRALPETVTIASNIIVQIVALILLIGDMVIYVITSSKMSTDWLETQNTLSDKQVETYYNRVVNYNEAKEKTKGLMMGIIMFVLCGGIALLTKPYFLAVGAVFAVFCYFLPGIKYKSSKKSLENEIAVKFPQWLMEISLQLQSQNVQVALFNSIPSAPMVLKPELIKLKQKLEKEPESVIPYLDFMKDFNVPEIQSSMKMLYSISEGTGGDSGKQIAEIIRRNNMLLDKSEKNAFDNVLAGMYGLFLAPQIIGGAKLLTDMMVFFVMFMTQLTV